MSIMTVVKDKLLLSTVVGIKEKPKGEQPFIEMSDEYFERVCRLETFGDVDKETVRFVLNCYLNHLLFN